MAKQPFVIEPALGVNLPLANRDGNPGG